MVRHHRKTTMTLWTMVGLVLAGVLVLLNPGQAQADIVLTIVTAGTGPVGGPFTYTYGVALAAAGNSSFSTQLTGITPVTETPKPNDDPNIINITTYWTGPDV